MKKLILLLSISLLLCSADLFAQKDEWTKQFELTKEATTLDDNFYKEPSADKIPSIVAKYQEAIDLLNKVQSLSSEYKDAVIYRKSWIYSQIAYLYEKVNDAKKQEEYIMKALDIWPTLGSISLSNTKKHIKFDNSHPFDRQYHKILYHASTAAYTNYKYEFVISLEEKYKPVQKEIEPFKEWVIYYNIARAYAGQYDDIFLDWFGEGDNSIKEEDVIEHYVKSLEVWEPVPDEDKERNKSPLDYTAKTLGSYTTNDNNLKLRTAKALYNVEKYEEADKWYSSYAKSASSPTLSAGWDYSESAMKEPDKTDARNAVNIIEQHTSGFLIPDWERLAKVYDFIGDTNRKSEIMKEIEKNKQRKEQERKEQEKRDEEARKHREKEERKANSRGQFSVAVATNPLMYIWNDYPVSLDIRIGRVSNEFRVNIAGTRPGKGDDFHFGQWNAKGVTDDLRYHFKGYEFSYALKILSKKGFSTTRSKRKQFVGGYFGFQPRYSTYDFEPEEISYMNSTTNLTEPHTISATANRYDFCLVGGFLGDNIGGFFHVDYYFGIGVGYRSLSISSDKTGFDPANYIYDDTTDRRYDPDRWNKIYVPVRLGLRIGINLL